MLLISSVVAASMLIGLASATGTSTNLCCQSTVSATSVVGSTLVALLGISLSEISGSLGLNCAPLTAESKCEGTEVTCIAQGPQCGLVVIGCTPTTL